jgi:hypothetical protein
MKRIDKTSLFEQFQGADLERLADCFVAIRKAGLSTSPYTQAGLNENSGNVWVWDEDWAGCVACSIGFDVFWVHSCRECGEEYEFKTYQELDNFLQENWNDCIACKEVEVEA